MDQFQDPDQESWPLPLLPGQWKTLALNDSCALLAKLAVTENALNMEPTAVLANYRRVRATNFPNIPNWLLLEAEAVLPDEKTGYRAFFYGPGSAVIPVHWASYPFQVMYQETPAELRTPGFARTYLKIFSCLLAGDAGRFIVVESRDEVELWLVDEAGIPAADASQVSPIQIEAADKGYKAKATLLYDGLVFRAEFSISDEGEVTMLSDEPLFEINAWLEDFRGPFRLIAAR